MNSTSSNHQAQTTCLISSRNSSFIKDAFSFLVKTFPPELDIRSKEWESGKEVPTIPAALKFLSGMVLGSEEAQLAFMENDNMLIKFFLKLQNVASSYNIGEYAENIIVNASTDKLKCAEAISSIKNEQERLEKERMHQNPLSFAQYYSQSSMVSSQKKDLRRPNQHSRHSSLQRTLAFTLIGVA